MPDAIAPYNFVPLPSAVLEGKQPPARDRYHPDRYTGWFTVRYNTLTPTYTRAAKGVTNFLAPLQNLVDNNQQGADFFHRGNEERTPVLPGSSLRGMIRNLFEVMTYSRMEFLSERRLFYRYMAAIGKTGLGEYYRRQFDTANLVGGVLRLSPDGSGIVEVQSTGKGFVAVDVNDPGFVGPLANLRRSYSGRPCYTTYRVSLRDSGRSVTLLKGSQAFPLPLYQICPPGTAGAVATVLIVPGPDIQHRHHYQAILPPASGKPRLFTMDRDVYKDYLNWGQMAHGSRFGSANAPRKLADGDPVFALVDHATNKVSVIGASMMLTLRYEHSIPEVAAHGIKTVPLDMTESVFGRVAPTLAETIKTRVYFEDALYTPKQKDESPWLSEDAAESIKVPQVLSGPKPTAVQMYLEQESNALDRDGNGLKHYNSPDARLRGHKMYWHRPEEAAEDALYPDDGKGLTSQETYIRPVKVQARFVGRIRFENLTETELGALYAALRLPDNCAHRFGMGKSLGLGSLSLDVIGTTILNMSTRYGSMSAEAGAYPEEQSETILHNAYAKFVRRVNAHEAQEEKVSQPQSPSLWNSPRMRQLAALLRDYPPLPANKTEMIPVQDHSDEQEKQWKNRDILPYPSQLVPRPDVKDIYDLSKPPPKPGSVRKPLPANNKAEPAPDPVAPSVPPAPLVATGDIVEVEITSLYNQKATVRVLAGPAAGQEVQNVTIRDKSGVGDTIKVKVTEVRNGIITAMTTRFP